MSCLQDFVTDNNPTAVFHADREIGIPDYVKSAEVITSESLEEYSAAGFADKVNRRFPVFSKAATWLSAAYFLGNKLDDAAVLGSIKAAAASFDMEDDMKQLEGLFSPLEKQASEPAVKYALTTDFGGAFGRDVQNFYPIHDFGSVIGSSELMLKDAGEEALPLEFLRVAAVNLLKAADEHGVPVEELHPKLQKLGTLRMPNFAGPMHAMYERKKYAGLPEAELQEYKDITEGAEAEFAKQAFESMEETILSVDKWVDLWCELDREKNVKYATVTNPYEAFYQGITVAEFDKQAAENFFIGDIMVPTFELNSLDDSDLDAKFSKSDASVIKEAKSRYRQGVTPIAGNGDASRELAKLDHQTQKDLLGLMLSKY